MAKEDLKDLQEIAQAHGLNLEQRDDGMVIASRKGHSVEFDPGVLETSIERPRSDI